MVDLRQQTEYEKRLDMQTIDMLENKVSELLADNGVLKNSNIQLDKIAKEDELKLEE